MKSKELKEKQDKLQADIQKLVLTAKTENRSLNSDEQGLFDRMYKDEEALDKEIKGYEKIERWDSHQLENLKSRSESKPGYSLSSNNNSSNEKQLDLALRGLLSQGQKGIDSDTRSYRAEAEKMGWLDGANLTRRNKKLAQDNFEMRTMNSTVATQGAEFVPQMLADQIYEYQLAYGGLFSAAYKFNSETGAPFTVPTNDDTGNSGALITQTTADTVVDLATGSKIFSSYTYTSDIALIPWELIRDSKFPIAQFVGKKLGQRINRKLASVFLTGTGSNQPQGIFAGTGGISTGVTTASPTTFTYAELMTLRFSLDGSYGDSPNAQWVISPDARRILFTMVDSNNRPLWTSGNFVGDITQAIPDRLDGKLVTVDYSMNAVTASKKPVIYGDVKECFWVRLVGDLTVAQSDQRYFDQRATGVVALFAVDSGVVNPNACKCMLTHA